MSKFFVLLVRDARNRTGMPLGSHSHAGRKLCGVGGPPLHTLQHTANKYDKAMQS